MAARYRAVVSHSGDRRMPAETDPHRCTLMAWPPDVPQCIYSAEQLEPARDAYAEIARTIARFEPVVLAVAPDDVDDAKTRAGDGVDVVAVPLDDAWMRDTGPLGVRAPGGEIEAVDFRFNAWGNKQVHDADRAIGVEMARHLGLDTVDADMVLEGGSIAVDGRGTLVTTERCLLNPNRNPALDRSAIEARLQAYLGAERVVWLPDAIAEDDGTDGHVDNVVAFTGNATVLLQGCDDPANPNAAIASENRERLRAAGFDVVVVPVLPYAEVEGRPYPVPYVNAYAGNGFVAVPVAGHAFDEEACRIIASQYPGREVLRVPGAVLAYGGGGVHCITLQVPA
jgi:agmatine deiminase